MAKLRHLAVHTADPEATAAFYQRVFDMEQVGPKNDSPVYCWCRRGDSNPHEVALNGF